ncbi:MAG: hypothetical protein QM579_08555 [Desulfovibrio sp.]|uniref:tetratricopeptide repeat protein n=1 Tax=Desulfovibrio sp. TaxID=885 RepID=UPI0039E4393A
MRRSKFSGVYSFSTDWTENRRKNHYFVWELPDGAFAVQELNKAFQPLAGPERISARSFAKNFRAEPEILAMPVTTPDLSRFENKEKTASSADAVQQEASAGEAGAESSGISPSLSQKPAASAARPNAVAAVAQGASQAAPQRGSQPLGQSAAKVSTQIQPRGAKASVLEAGKSAAAVTNAGQRPPQPRTDAASFNQPGDPAAAVTAKPGAQRLQPAQKISSPPLRMVVAGEDQGLAFQKVSAAPSKGAPAISSALGQGASLAGNKIFAAELDMDAKLPLPGSSPAAASSPMSLEAMRKAKMTESRLRETFRQTLLRLRRPRERQAALSALEQLAGATEDICTMHKHMFRDFGVRLRQSSQPALALLFSRKVVELAPDDDHAHFNLARILCLLGQFDEAAAHIRAAMTVGGEDPTYFRMLIHIRKEKLQNQGQSSSHGR